MGVVRYVCQLHITAFVMLTCNMWKVITRSQQMFCTIMHLCNNNNNTGIMH